MVNNLIYRRLISLLGFVFLFSVAAYSAAKPFVVVIDAGHGGKDPGSIGYTLKIKEKNINLKAALKLGELLEKEQGVKVIYTRRKDVFIPLDQRADIANRAKADLFISIHANAAENRSARGTETFTVGSSSTNMEVAMRENSVILYESDYKTKYEGFDPNSSESYIMFDFIQSSYKEQSISFASNVEKQFASQNRKSRGVRQAGFLVLKQTSMPAVLVELGYISNKEEEAFLSKDANVETMAKSIYRAFLTYKKQYDKNNGMSYHQETKPEVKQEVKQDVKEPEKKTPTDTQPAAPTENKAENKAENKTEQKSDAKPEVKSEEKGTQKEDVIRYAVQFCSSNVAKPLDCKDFKGFVPAKEFVETGVYKYKYVYGDEKTFQGGLKLREEVKKKFSDAFLVVLKNGKKLPTEEARKYYK